MSIDSFEKSFVINTTPEAVSQFWEDYNNPVKVTKVTKVTKASINLEESSARGVELLRKNISKLDDVLLTNRR